MSRQDANAAFARTSFLYGGNAAYVEQLQSHYEADPASVDAEWRAMIAEIKDEIRGRIVPVEMFDETQRLMKEYRAGKGGK